MEGLVYLPIGKTLEEINYRFGEFESIEELIRCVRIVKLYMRIFYENAPENMILQSNEALEQSISFNEHEERFHYFEDELREIELINKYDKMPLVIIKRENVYIPKEYTTTSRKEIINQILSREGKNE